MAALVDTNVLVYRFDGRFPDKRKIAAGILRRGILEDSVIRCGRRIRLLWNLLRPRRVRCEAKRA